MPPMLTLLSGFSPLAGFTEIWEPNFNAVAYHPTTGAENDYQDFNLYLPDDELWPVPATGYPCVVRINLDDGYTGSSKPADLSADQFGYAVVEAGMALCDATITFTTTGGSVTNGGLFNDPGDAGWSGASDIPEQDVLWIIQKLRDLSSSFGIDGTKIGLYGGNNAAGTVALWVAMSSDFADSGASTTQEQQSSVPTCCLVVEPTTWYDACQLTVAQNHLRDTTVTTNPAATLGDATADHRTQASPLYRATLSATTVPCVVLSQDDVADQTWKRVLPSTRYFLASQFLAALDDGWHSEAWVEWMRRHATHSVFHAQRSELWVEDAARRTEADRVVDDTGDSLNGHVVAYFQAGLGHTQNAEAWAFPIGWAHRVSTTRAAVASDSTLSHRRQTRHGVSEHRLAASTRTWRIGHQSLTDAQAAALRTLEQNVRGRVHPFDFSPPDTYGTLSAHIVSDSLVLTAVAHDQWAYELDVEES